MIVKPIREKLVSREGEEKGILDRVFEKTTSYKNLINVDLDSLTPIDTNKIIKRMEAEMKTAAQELNFELAAALRDKILELKKN